MSKWVMEVQIDGDGDELVRILSVENGKAELKYVATSEADATYLISAFDWMDSFKDGVVRAVPEPQKKRKKVQKPRTMVLELELPEQPSE